MNVIVWKSYGNIDVYAVQTAGQLTEVLAKVQVATARWGIDERFNALAERVRAFVEDHRLDRARIELASFAWKHCMDTDAFELFELSQVK